MPFTNELAILRKVSGKEALSEGYVYGYSDSDSTLHASLQVLTS